MQIDYTPKLSFDDVLLEPQFTNITSRSEVSLLRTFKLPHTNKTWGPVIPVCAANMSTVGTISMAKELIKLQCVTALHKHYPVDRLVSFWKYLEENNAEDYVFYSIGMIENDMVKLKEFKNLFGRVPRHWNFDVANGYQKSFYDTISRLRDTYPDINLMAGNIATEEGAYKIIKSGATFAKCGIASGSACETAIVAATGVPQLSALLESAIAAKEAGGHLISDGGITTPACAAKAFAGGSGMIMIGGMFAGHDQCESEFIYDEEGNKTGVEFYGMASRKAMEKYNNGVANYRSSEGKVVTVKYRGAIENTLLHLLGGIRSACTYSNSRNLIELHQNAKFITVRQTHNKVFG